ncbi:oxidoreductase/transition metal ion-binding protein [Rhynchospora pubera]|uniref:Oxidoreductase/transition metal ion-binding protein n=1 Tax=Rhynchospora pubera TaxID=906938 RepID=A0AAV8GY25_9POAL|nr:oxidoreductase/transition metal ion-binding protein [Rhynchospora pubera]
MSSTSLLNHPPWLPNPVKRNQCFLLSFDGTRSTHSSLPIRRVRFRFLSPRVSRLKVDACWIPSNEISRDEFGGWLADTTETVDSNGWKKYVFVGFTAPVVILLAGLAYHTYHRRGIKYSIPAPFTCFHEKFTKPAKDTDAREIEASQFSESKLDESANVSLDKLKENFYSAPSEGYRVAITVPADAGQQNALSVLKKLQIVENEANADELCTRREFARWFVKLSSNMERSRRHKITPSVLVKEPAVSAFDDVEIGDPDFWCIQCLAEAGLVPSKLSSVNSSLSGSYFLPESYLSRFDMLNWKALVEYATTTEVDRKIINKKATILDLSACPGLSAPLFTDLLSGEGSIFSRVFGNARLIQPYKPVTKAQAAVALTSGRMENFINEELTRIELETRLKLSEMEDIKRDFNQKGEIEKFWKAKIEMEQEREIKSQEALESALFELRRERKEKEEGLSENMKEKIALEGERTVLLGLKREIDELSERVNDEKKQVMHEKVNVDKIYVDVNGKYELLVEKKSRLEAEKEAVHVLRSWVEDEANRLQTRAKILEQAVGRWRFSSNENSVGKLD